MNIAVVGAGKWGEALHLAFLENHNSKIGSRRKKDIVNFYDYKELLKGGVYRLSSFCSVYKRVFRAKLYF